MSGSTTRQKVLLPLIRHVMPNIIANDIIGVSPMRGPTNQIHTLRTRFGWHIPSLTRSRVDPQIYNSFLRINNRRSTQCDRDFENAGYWCATYALNEVIDWCEQQFGQPGFWFNTCSGTVWFASQEDFMTYRMVWQ